MEPPAPNTENVIPSNTNSANHPFHTDPNPQGEGETCCGCIPVRVGMMTLGILIITNSLF